MLAPARLLVAVPAFAAVVWLAFAALRIGTADAIVFEALREIGTWRASRNVPGVETIGWIEADLSEASARVPGNPTAHELAGILKTFDLRDPEYRQAALVHFGKALVFRPTSAYTWANIAELKYRIGETDALFESALRRAILTGPAEPEVQRTVAEFGLAVWPDVAPESRAAIDRAVKGAMSRNPMEMLQIARRRGRLDVACRHLSLRAEPKWLQLCQSTE